jgi:hypothetical protein
MHCFTVLPHAPASTTTEGHVAPAAHGGAAGVAQFWAWATHAIPAAQSLSALHGPGTHAETGVVSHTGGVQGSLGAQAISGQAATLLV